jgi:hypothetical protein
LPLERPRGGEKVEYPQMDRDLHLLMLMHRQVEEARGFGVEEPRLEYREEPPEVSVRVAGVDVVEEVCAGGYYHAGELIEDAGEYLRRLDEHGYVRLAPGDADGTGQVEITDEGMKKIRQRRAFEANLRRRLTMPEVFLVGGPRVGVMDLWRADWEGRQITVRNRRVFLGGRRTPVTEYLNVDDRFPPGYRVEKDGSSKDLYGELRTVDGAHEVHAHIGPTTPFRRLGCLISVDGVVVGGDVGRRFLS